MNAFYQRELAGMVLRVIPTKILPLADLSSLHPYIALPNFTGLTARHGRDRWWKVHYTGWIVDAINANRHSHILTVEDPIEFVHADKRSVVNQREVGQRYGLIFDRFARFATAGSRRHSYWRNA